jgi:outer membrane protein assembly factor BamB
MRRIASTFPLAALLLTAISAATARADWPHWRGPTRDGLSPETSGYQDGRWLSDKPLWSGSFGAGGSSPIAIGNAAYFFGWAGGQDRLTAVEAATGKRLWSVSYAARERGRHATGDEGFYGGPSSTPEFDAATGWIYTLGLDGELRACDTRDKGRLVWRLNLYDQYEAPQRPKIGRSSPRDYGYTTSPLVHNDWLIVEVGGKAGTLVAFDKRSGREVWTSQAKRRAGHTAGLAPMTVAGEPCVAVLTLTHLLVASLASESPGRTVAEHPWETEYANNIPSPAVSGDRVIVTSGYNHETICCLQILPGQAKQLWEQPYHSKICTPVIARERVYFAFEKLRCLDLASGRQFFEGGSFGDAGSCIFTADERLIVFGGRGKLALVAGPKESPAAYRQLAASGPLFTSDVWPHVVLAGGRLLCKDREGNVKCLATNRP